MGEPRDDKPLLDEDEDEVEVEELPIILKSIICGPSRGDGDMKVKEEAAAGETASAKLTIVGGAVNHCAPSGGC